MNNGTITNDTCNNCPHREACRQACDTQPLVWCALLSPPPAIPIAAGGDQAKTKVATD